MAYGSSGLSCRLLRQARSCPCCAKGHNDHGKSDLERLFATAHEHDLIVIAVVFLELSQHFDVRGRRLCSLPRASFTAPSHDIGPFQSLFLELFFHNRGFSFLRLSASVLLLIRKFECPEVPQANPIAMLAKLCQRRIGFGRASLPKALEPRFLSDRPPVIQEHSHWRRIATHRLIKKLARTISDTSLPSMRFAMKSRKSSELLAPA
jgi:hypothetical protein